MRVLDWIARTFTFAQFDDSPTPGPSTPTRPGGGGGGGGGDERPDNPFVGGFVVNRPSPVGGYGPYRPGPTSGFDPYRANDLRHILSRMVNQGSVYDLQLALVQAGFLNDDVNWGIIDDDTEAALETVLTYANQHGIPWQDVLSQAAAGGGFGPDGGGGGGGGGLGPTVIQLPNRDDLIAAWDETGFALTGENLDDDLTEAAVEAVLDSLRTQQERQVQREMDLAGTGEGVAFVESAPDVNRLLEEQVRERAPQKVMNKQTRDAMEVWFEMIGEPL